MNTPESDLKGEAWHFFSRVCLVATMFAVTTVNAFTVTKDTNRPPIEAVVLFTKGASTDHLVLSGSADTPFAVTDAGSLQASIKGQVALDARIAWKAAKGRPGAFAVTDHAYLMLTCRVEGTGRKALPNGKSIEQRGGNLWLPVVIYDAEGKRIGSVNLAAVTVGEITPAETTVLRIPMFLFTFWNDGSKPIPDFYAIGFTWGEPRAPMEHDYRLVIDHIALAN